VSQEVSDVAGEVFAPGVFAREVFTRSVFVRSLEETRLIASKLASTLKPGDVVSLNGELGAGKTAFVQGLASALGISETVTSPTFTIMRQYPLVHATIPQLLHLDAYRLEGADALEELGLFELLESGAVAFVEWGDLVAGEFDDEALRISVDVDDNDVRTFRMSSAHERWQSRVIDVVAAFENENGEHENLANEKTRNSETRNSETRK
jgi:tRNA threonylcarbamoyladenosine biosynthesis protein TsaE